MPATPQDNEETRRHLESMQVRAFEKLGGTLEELKGLYRQRQARWVLDCAANWLRFSFLRAVAEKPLADARATCEAWLQQVPTRFEDPFDYEVVRKRFDTIHSVAASVDRLLPFKPLLGTVAAGELGAEAKQPGAGYILAVNGGALKISWSLSKILARSLPTLNDGSGRDAFDTDWPEVQKHLRSSSEPSRRFRELLVAIVARSHPYFARQYLMDRDHDKRALDFVAALNAGTELFLVGHEYAHLTDGHLDGKVRRRPEKEFPAEPIRLRVRTLEPNLQFTREFDADQLALRLAHPALDSMRFNNEASILGAVLCIRAIEILDRVSGRERTKVRSGNLDRLADCAVQEPADRMHPPTSCRVWMLKQHAWKQPEVLRKVELLERILGHLCSEVAMCA